MKNLAGIPDETVIDGEAGALKLEAPLSSQYLRSSSEFFGFTEDKNYQPNGTRIAFWADTRDEVDRLAKLMHRFEFVDSSETLARPISAIGCAIVVSPGDIAFDWVVLSKPITERSSRTRR